MESASPLGGGDGGGGGVAARSTRVVVVVVVVVDAAVVAVVVVGGEAATITATGGGDDDGGATIAPPAALACRSATHAPHRNSASPSINTRALGLRARQSSHAAGRGARSDATSRVEMLGIDIASERDAGATTALVVVVIVVVVVVVVVVVAVVVEVDRVGSSRIDVASAAADCMARTLIVPVSANSSRLSSAQFRHSQNVTPLRCQYSTLEKKRKNSNKFKNTTKKPVEKWRKIEREHKTLI